MTARQVEKLKRLRAERDDAAVAASLRALTAAASSGEGNLLELAVSAARARATVGEISDALEKQWGRCAPDGRLSPRKPALSTFPREHFSP